MNILNSRTILLTILIAITASAISCRKQAEVEPSVPVTDPDLLAIVDGREIRVADFLNAVERSSQRSTPPDTNETILQDLILREAMVASALNAGLADDPEVKRFYENYLIGTLKTVELEPKLTSATVDETKIQRFYDQHQADYVIPEKVRIAILFRATTTANAEAMVVEMTNVRMQALSLSDAESDFGKLAIRHSEDQATRYNGGNIGWITKGKGHARLPESVVEAAFLLRNIGELTPVVATDKGVYLAKLIDRQQQSIRSFDSVKETIRFQLLQELRVAIAQEFENEIIQSVEIQQYPDALKRIIADQPPPPSATPPRLPH